MVTSIWFVAAAPKLILLSFGRFQFKMFGTTMLLAKKDPLTGTLPEFSTEVNCRIERSFALFAFVWSSAPHYTPHNYIEGEKSPAPHYTSHNYIEGGKIASSRSHCSLPPLTLRPGGCPSLALDTRTAMTSPRRPTSRMFIPLILHSLHFYHPPQPQLTIIPK